MALAYRDLATEYNESLRHGDWARAVELLKKMAKCRRWEGSTADELKLLMLAFYFSTSGCAGTPNIDKDLADAIVDSSRCYGAELCDVEQLYLDTVRAGTMPSHILSIRDSLYLFECCACGNTTQARVILEEAKRHKR